MKKIMNTPQSYVIDMCRGIAAAHPELEFAEKFKIVKKKDINTSKVTLISGGGSGHEPAHAGFVGRGMLDAAVCGDVFASPSQVQIYNALKLTASDKGTLMIVKNYSGDCMNFNGAGADAAEELGIKIDTVYVNDDVAVTGSSYTNDDYVVGRRGVAGTMFVHKIAGAAAEQGKDLPEVKRLAQKAIDNLASIGFALSSCTPPAKGTPIFSLDEDKIEFGVGIHGEPGKSTDNYATADELASKMVAQLADNAVIKLSRGDEIAVIVNGFGATPLSELYILNNSVASIIADRGYKVHKTLVGNYMTSLDMAGASVTFLKLDEELKALLDYPVSTPALVWGGAADDESALALEAMRAISKALGVTKAKADEPNKVKSVSVSKEDDADAVYTVKGKPVYGDALNTAAFVEVVDKMADIVIANEVPFCDADKMGDGDFGMSIAKGFRQLKQDWGSRKKGNIGEFLLSCSEVIKEYCGGASGPIWGSAFKYAGKAAVGKESVTLSDIAAIMQAANTGVYETGKRSFGKGAVVGDKTLVDALKPCADALEAAAAAGDKLADGVVKGAKAAVEGAEATKTFVAVLGRAGTVGEKSIGYPDAGAYGLGVIFTGLAEFIVSKIK